jgi:hypothetical protein
MFQSCLYRVLEMHVKRHIVVGMGIGSYMVELKKETLR